MGNEASVPEGGGVAGHDPFNPYANVKIKPKEVVASPKAVTPPTPSSPASPTIPSSRRTRGLSEGGAAGPSLDVSRKAIVDRPSTYKAAERGWLAGGQSRVCTPAEVRRPRTSGTAMRPGTSSVRSSTQTLAAQMGELLKEAPKPAALTLDQKLEEKKSELIGKLATFITNSPTKLPTELPRVMAIPPPNPAPGALSGAAKASWMNKLLQSRQAMLDGVKERLGQPGAAPMYEALSQEGVGGEVEKSLGDTYATFAGFQGTINHMMETGLSEELLEQFFMSEEAEQQLTTYQKWGVIRHAAEQVLQVYANRSNSSSVEAEEWVTPKVLDTRTGVAAAYTNTVDGALAQGLVCMLLVDDGRLVEQEGGAKDLAALLPADLWQVIKAACPHKVPSGQRLERLSVLGRQLLSATVSLEQRYGVGAVKALKVVLAVDCEQESFAVAELQRWSFFGLTPAHVAILPLPRFHGFCQDMKSERLVHVKGSPRLLLGTGYALYLLNSPAEAYTIDAASGSPCCLGGSVLEWLREQRANWLHVGLTSDCERLRPDASLDPDFLAGALYCADREGANMVMEVLNCRHERDVRTYNSIVLGRTGHGGGACNLPATALRTVRSYQLMKEQAASATGLFVSSQRYAFKVPALQALLTDPANFRADVTLHGFYAYATLDLAEVTLLPGAKCGAVRTTRAAPGPAMGEVVFNRNWLIYAAGVLEEQDRVDAFRQRAIGLIKMDKLSSSMNKISGMPKDLLKPGQLHVPGKEPETAPAAAAADGVLSPGFKERKPGMVVVLLLSVEHRVLAGTALRLARLFIRNIVDKLHVVLLLGSGDKEVSAGQQVDLIKQVMDEVVDKELEFNGQLSREVINRGDKTQEAVMAVLEQQQAGMVVVPSHKLCGAAVGDLGSTASSLAYIVAKNVTTIPVLVVKGNTAGRYVHPNTAAMAPQQAPQPTTASAQAAAAAAAAAAMLSGTPSSSASAQSGVALTNSSRDHVVAMAYLEGTTVAPIVEAVSSQLVVPGRDVLVLAKTQAYERPGLLSMRARRVFVQARMAAVEDLKVEERAYAGNAVQELPRAVEGEGVDVLVVSVAGELPIPKDVEELLKACKTSVYILRNKEALPANPASQLAPLQVEQPAVGYAYRSSTASKH